MTNEHTPAFELVVAGRKIDQRTMPARRFKALGSELTTQLGREPTAAERIMLMNAATLSMLLEQETADLLEGKAVDHENHRKNVAALRQLLIQLGMAKKSRDITKSDATPGDAFGAAIIEANRESH